MFSRILTVAAVALMFSAQVKAHAAIAPVLGVSGDPVRADVRRPTILRPCGNVNIAENLDTTTPVAAQADGSFIVTVTNFNPGVDGSRSVSLAVDAAGTGKRANFVKGDVTTNGVAAPQTLGSDQVTAVLPPGTKCTGGASGNLCLASFKTISGFGNCVVVKQDNTTVATTSEAATAAVSSVAIASVDTATSTAAASTNTEIITEAPPKGTRAARALRAGLEAERQSKRTVFNWIWA
ncbi:hypothetical protein C0995_005945 [Termitomyces sp. Mi166|nr:hypothetical protein C0995_005945 [Termitomyces sp. Mi166\